MFGPIDRDALGAAAQVTINSVHASITQYAEAGLFDTHVCDAVCKELDPLFELLCVTGPALSDEKFWEAFQRQFGFATARDRVTPMNAANLCPEPVALIRAANLLRLAYNENVAQQARTAGGIRVEQIQATRKRLATSLGVADPSDIALLRNSSEGNNAISCGYRDWRVTSDVSQLDTVVVWEENHPTNLESWRLRRDWGARSSREGDDPRPGDPFRLIVVKLNPKDDVETMARAFTSQITDRTRFVSYTETTNGSGFRIPEAVMKRIWDHVDGKNEAGKKYENCHIHVDGTMAWGARPVNLSKPWCHSFVSSAHKWYLGPKETAVFYMSKDKVQNFSPSIFAYDYRIVVGTWAEMPKSAMRFELIGQRDDVNLITLDQTQQMWDALAPPQPAGARRVPRQGAQEGPAGVQPTLDAGHAGGGRPKLGHRARRGGPQGRLPQPLRLALRQVPDRRLRRPQDLPPLPAHLQYRV